MSPPPAIPPAAVLVTGGAGFIGVNLARLLLAAGRRVTVYDDFSVGSRARLAALDVAVIEGDVLDAQALARAVAGHDAVVHLAAQTGVPLSLEDPRRDLQLNIVGTLNVLEACRHHLAGGRPRMVFASSNAPLGRQTPPAREDAAPLPVSPYGASKLAGEAYCLAYHGSFGVPAVALRFANVYGPESDYKGSVVATFMRRLRRGEGLVLDGGGGQTRDFIHVDDLCRAILAALDADASVAGEVFQVATGVETSIRDLAAALERTVGRPVARAAAPPRPADVARNVSDISKAGRMLGWRPAVPLDEGLRRTWDWFCRDGGGDLR